MARRRRRYSRRRGRSFGPWDLLIFIVVGAAVFGSILVVGQAIVNAISDHILLISSVIVLVAAGSTFLYFYSRYEERHSRDLSFAELQHLENLRRMTSREFEKYIIWMFQKRGYEAKEGPGQGDHGIDGEIWSGSARYALQMKKYDARNRVGEKEVRDFHGSILHTHTYLGGKFITTSDFTPAARKWAEEVPMIELWNGEKLLEELRKVEVGHVFDRR